MNSLLKYGFGLQDVNYIKTEYISQGIKIHVRTKESKLKCSECGSGDVIKKGTKLREFRTAPIGLKAVYVVATVQRLSCNECQSIRQERLSWADKKKLTRVD